MPVPDFSPGEVLTASAMDSIGLWLVKTQTISTGATSIVVNDAFNSNFENYRIILSGFIGSSAGGDVRLQLSGSTGSTYSSCGYFMAYGTTTVNGFAPAATTFWTVSPYNNVRHSAVIDILAPQIAQQSFFYAMGSHTASFYQFNGVNSSTVQSTGFTLTNSVSTNFTAGTIRVYGYRN